MCSNEIQGDYALRRPTFEQYDGIDVLRFRSAWQIKLLLDDLFLDFITEYIESHESPYRIILCLESVSGLTLTDLGNLVAVFHPFVEDSGLICLCNLQPDVIELASLHLTDCLFLVTANLEDAISKIKSAGES